MLRAEAVGKQDTGEAVVRRNRLLIDADEGGENDSWHVPDIHSHILGYFVDWLTS